MTAYIDRTALSRRPASLRPRPRSPFADRFAATRHGQVEERWGPNHALEEWSLEEPTGSFEVLGPESVATPLDRADDHAGGRLAGQTPPEPAGSPSPPNPPATLPESRDVPAAPPRGISPEKAIPLAPGVAGVAPGRAPVDPARPRSASLRSRGEGPQPSPGGFRRGSSPVDGSSSSRDEMAGSGPAQGGAAAAATPSNLLARMARLAGEAGWGVSVESEPTGGEPPAPPRRLNPTAPDARMEPSPGTRAETSARRPARSEPPRGADPALQTHLNAPTPGGPIRPRRAAGHYRLTASPGPSQTPPVESSGVDPGPAGPAPAGSAGGDSADGGYDSIEVSSIPAVRHPGPNAQGKARLRSADPGAAPSPRASDHELPYPDEVTVTIGRIDVRVSLPPADPAPTPRPAARAPTGLDRYLEARTGRRIG